MTTAPTRPQKTAMLLARRIVSDIDRAKKLDMVAAYFSPSRAMLRRIGDVAARGGEAAVLTAAKSDNTATIAAARHTYTRLLRRGVEMYEFDQCRLHMKLIVVDDALPLACRRDQGRHLPSPDQPGR